MLSFYLFWECVSNVFNLMMLLQRLVASCCCCCCCRVSWAPSSPVRVGRVRGRRWPVARRHLHSRSQVSCLACVCVWVCICVCHCECASFTCCCCVCFDKRVSWPCFSIGAIIIYYCCQRVEQVLIVQVAFRRHQLRLRQRLRRRLRQQRRLAPLALRRFCIESPPLVWQFGFGIDFSRCLRCCTWAMMILIITLN